ncbi:MAG: hypothetical protein VW907_01435, partial [Opitutae bacterium]
SKWIGMNVLTINPETVMIDPRQKKLKEQIGNEMEQVDVILRHSRTLGGGHHCTRNDYDREGLVSLLSEISQKYQIQVFIEPGEAVALDAGILVGRVLDLMQSQNKAHALLDLSATCHAPDVIEAPYRPALLGEVEGGGYPYILGGSSCLTADHFGMYTMDKPLQRGDRLAFLDQAHYTMVKTNTFNGVPLPSLALWNSQTDQLSVIKEFDYEEFVNRLS